MVKDNSLMNIKETADENLVNDLMLMLLPKEA